MQRRIIRQHETVQDYAAWHFSAAPPSSAARDVSVVVAVLACAAGQPSTISGSDRALRRLFGDRRSKRSAASRAFGHRRTRVSRDTELAQIVSKSIS
jgi:hypothetical protein